MLNRFTFEKHPCVCSLHKTVSIKLWRASIQHRQSQVPIVAIPLKSFCVYDKSRPIAVGFLLGLLSRLWPPFGKTGHSDLQAPIIICNCGKVKGKARLFTAIYGSLYLMCHTSQGSIALNSLLIGRLGSVQPRPAACPLDQAMKRRGCNRNQSSPFC